LSCTTLATTETATRSVPAKFSLSLNSRVFISRPAEGEFFPGSVVGLKAEVLYDDGGEDKHD